MRRLARVDVAFVHLDQFAVGGQGVDVEASRVTYHDEGDRSPLDLSFVEGLDIVEVELGEVIQQPPAGVALVAKLLPLVDNLL